MIADISPIRMRGSMLATTTVWACIGELFGMLLGLEFCFGTEKLWHIAFVIPNLLIIPALLVLSWAPESPRCLLLQGDKEAALKALEFYQVCRFIFIDFCLEVRRLANFNERFFG